MSEEGDIDVESAEDVPDIAVEATATTSEDRSDIYSPSVSQPACRVGIHLCNCYASTCEVSFSNTMKYGKS